MIKEFFSRSVSADSATKARKCSTISVTSKDCKKSDGISFTIVTGDDDTKLTVINKAGTANITFYKNRIKNTTYTVRKASHDEFDITIAHDAANTTRTSSYPYNIELTSVLKRNSVYTLSISERGFTNHLPPNSAGVAWKTWPSLLLTFTPPVKSCSLARPKGSKPE